MSYLRFQTNIRCENTGRWIGIFSAAGELRDDDRIEPWFAEPLRETLQWFNTNLKVPNAEQVKKRCLFWFDCNSPDVLGAVWDLVTVLRQHDIDVASTKCVDPGKIVYRDRHQIAAIPSRRVYRILR